MSATSPPPQSAISPPYNQNDYIGEKLEQRDIFKRYRRENEQRHRLSDAWEGDEPTTLAQRRKQRPTNVNLLEGNFSPPNSLPSTPFSADSISAFPDKRFRDVYYAALIRVTLLQAMTHLSQRSRESLEEARELATEAYCISWRYEVGDEFMARCSYWIGLAVYLLDSDSPGKLPTYWFNEALVAEKKFPEGQWARGWIKRIEKEREKDKGKQTSWVWDSVSSRVSSIAGSLWRQSAPVQTTPAEEEHEGTKNRPLSLHYDKPHLQRMPTFDSVAPLLTIRKASSSVSSSQSSPGEQLSPQSIARHRTQTLNALEQGPKPLPSKRVSFPADLGGKGKEKGRPYSYSGVMAVLEQKFRPETHLGIVENRQPFQVSSPDLTEKNRPFFRLQNLTRLDVQSPALSPRTAFPPPRRIVREKFAGESEEEDGPASHRRKKSLREQVGLPPGLKSPEKRAEEGERSAEEKSEDDFKPAHRRKKSLRETLRLPPGLKSPEKRAEEGESPV